MAVSLQFVEVGRPEENKMHIRRTIRSHAARTGHSTDCRQNKDWPIPRKRRKNGIIWPITVNGSKDRPPRSLQNGHEKTISNDQCSPQREESLIRFPGSDRAVPAITCRLQSLPFLPLVVTNYLTHLAVAIPELDGPHEDCLLQKAWFPMVLHSPVLFQVITLFSASHYASYHSDMSYASHLLFMKQCALAGLQQALSRDGTFSRDENIAAATKMASYEAIYGTEEAYHIHMKAVEYMLNCRGGLSSLGMNGFLARLLMFVDTNSAFLLNTRLHLSDSAFPRREPFILPNPGRFIGVS